MDKQAFLARVEEYKKAGLRLALINATTIMPAEGETEAFEIVWGFSKDGRPAQGETAALEMIRERVAIGDEVPSVSPSFAAAFLYENEIRELFGINVTGLDLDLRGQLYKTATKVPFSHRAIRARLEANAAAGSGATLATPAHGTVHGAPAHGAPKP